LEYVVLEYKSQLYYSLRIGTQVVTIMSGCWRDVEVQRRREHQYLTYCDLKMDEW
jgi:hypothetical protein